MAKTYKSKISKGLAAFVYGTIVACFLPLLVDCNLIILALFVLLLLFVTWALFGIRYTIDGHNLIITFLIRRTIYDIRKITCISSCHNLISAPAASLNRLEIQCGNHKFLISPRREQLFIEDICAINPNVVVKA